MMSFAKKNALARRVAAGAVLVAAGAVLGAFALAGCAKKAEEKPVAPCDAKIYTNEMSKIYKTKLLIHRGVKREIADKIALNYSNFRLLKRVETDSVVRFVCQTRVEGSVNEKNSSSNVIYRIEENKINGGKNINIITVPVEFVPKV